MDKAGARRFYSAARDYMALNYPDELEWVKSVTPSTFERMTFRAFLEAYCWVVFTAGFRVSTVRLKFPAIKKVFCAFRPEKVCALESPIQDFPIDNKLKVRSFLKGVRQLSKEGFERFKARVRAAGDDGMEELVCLPYIKGVTKKHLARNIGIKSVAKDDVWLVRLSATFASNDVDQLVEFLSKAYGDRPGVVDLVLWQYCADCGCED